MDDDIVSSPPSPNCRKRPAPEDTPSKKALNLRGTQFMMPTPPDTDNSNSTSPDGSLHVDGQERAASPAPSDSTALSSVQEVPDPQSSAFLVAGSSTAPSASASGPPPAKRRKLTTSEREEKTRQKAIKAAQTAEKKAKADEAKAVKADEKRIRDAEKRKKAEEQETKKREIELEKERKAQAKLAKERSQMRLGAFFQKPPMDAEEQQPRSRRKSLSLEPFDAVADTIKSSASPAKVTPPPSVKKPVLSDYQKTFLSFELRPDTSLAPRVQTSDLENDRFDHELCDPSIQEKYHLGLVSSYASLESYFGPPSNRGIPYPNIQKIVERLQGYSQEPIDLTEGVPVESGVDVLRKIPVRHIHHHEDVRPAYIGTYTKIRSPRKIRQVTRNPFSRARPDTNYDYDSEAEWEEPEEGDEEIGDEEDDEADSQADAGEMEDFLDDEDDTANKNRRKAMITADLVPESTGLCWENAKGQFQIPHKAQEIYDMRIGVLLHGFSGETIDPFTTTYWNEPIEAVAQQPAITKNGLMAPPRAPLQPKLNFNGNQQQQHDLIGASEGQKGPITSVAATQSGNRGRKPAPRTLSKEDLAEFTDAVVGSPLGKLDLQKGLKSRFPKLTNDAIKENLNALFAQKGAGKTKEWVYVGDS